MRHDTHKQLLLIFPCFYFPAKWWAKKLKKRDIDDFTEDVQFENFLSESLTLDGILISKLFGLSDYNICEFKRRKKIVDDGDDSVSCRIVSSFATDSLQRDFEREMFWNLSSLLTACSSA